ncbi:MAG TPA: hypothetical protein VFD13_03920 [Candidatus Kapabacteria bacterium]|nr:hypothetical protein [Candidatus Kapabacteria bacterium]
MKLPNAENAIIADAKLTEYLLSTTHPEGKDKAVIFYSRGFSLHRLDELRTGLKNLAMENEVSKTKETIHGMKYLVEGLLETPDGRGILLRTVWMVDREGTIPRLVSAYPA